MKAEILSLSQNGVTHIVSSDGEKITISLVTPNPRKSDPVADHEARHAVVAGQIKWATVIPGSGYLGACSPAEMTPATAAAAYDCNGTGWDRRICEETLGVSWSQASAMASAVLSGREDEVGEVAGMLEEHGTITQVHMDQARRNVERRRLGIFPVRVETIRPNGQKRVTVTESFHHQVALPLAV